MDEARRVIDRLGRIEALREAGAPPAELLPELRALVREGERWVAVEGHGTRAARVALEELDERLPTVASEAGIGPERREVVAGIGG